MPCPRVLTRSTGSLAPEKSGGYSVWLQRDHSARTISISQEAFINSILTCFNFADATTVTTPLAPGIHLSAAESPTFQDEIAEMATCSYREPVGARTSLSPSGCLPVSVVTLVAFIGMWPSAHYVISRGSMDGASRLEVRPRISLFSQMPTGSHRDDRRSIGAYITKTCNGAVSWNSILCCTLVNGSRVYGALPSVEGVSMDS
jgi:hypothetical protein